LYIEWRDELEGVSDFIVVVDNEGGTWDKRGNGDGDAYVSRDFGMEGHSEEGAEPPQSLVDIVVTVTAPSSPEIKPPPTDGLPRSADEYGDSYELTFQPPDNLTVPANRHITSMDSSNVSRHTPFEEVLANTAMPEPGPDYFAVRQQLWRTPHGSGPKSSPKRSRKLQVLLQRDGPLDKQQDWDAGLDKIWKGIIGGQKLRERIPLRDLVCHCLS
jgi:hypothetical protein